MDDLTKLCASEFAVHIDELYSARRIETFSDGPDWIEVPVVGLFHKVGDAIAVAALEELRRRALAWRVRFETEGPPWAQPLPVSWDKLCKLSRIGELTEAGVFASISTTVDWKWRPILPAACSTRNGTRNTHHSVAL
jgi:hypothetical protein